MARAIANIAVPYPNGVTAIDPCCGIGNVLVEALSMEIDIVGRDINPLVTRGSRENIAYFGYTCDVTTGPIADVTDHYDKIGRASCREREERWGVVEGVNKE